MIKDYYFPLCWRVIAIEFSSCGERLYCSPNKDIRLSCSIEPRRRSSGTMLAVYSGNMAVSAGLCGVRKARLFDCEKLPLWVGDGSRPPDLVSVETDERSREWAGKCAKESVNISPLWRRGVRAGGWIMDGGGRSDKGRDYLGTCYNSTTHTQPLQPGCHGLLWMVEQRAGLPPIQPDPLSELSNKDYNTQLSEAQRPGTWN